MDKYSFLSYLPIKHGKFQWPTVITRGSMFGSLGKCSLPLVHLVPFSSFFT